MPRERLQQIVQQSGQSADALAGCYYALAKELEDVGRYQESFDALSRGATLVRISTTAGFRPSAVDPKNRDTRYLGAWIRVGG